MKASDIPDAWWRVTCEQIHHPIACVDLEHKFVWCNGAYERLTGYSVVELSHRRWMDITVSDDVEGDMDSVSSVMTGKIESYSISKRYRHKRGHEVPIELTVWRFPRVAGMMTCFIVEAVPASATRLEVEEMHQSCLRAIGKLEEQLEKVQMSREERKHSDSQVVNVGNNSTDIYRYIVMALVVLIGAVSYLAYVASWPQHQGGAQPPAPVKGTD